MMSENEAVSGADRAGERLRAAREAAGLSLTDIAARTRVTQRHLEAIEADDFGALPSPTYSVGFARAYARAVGADEVAIAALVRGQLEGGLRARQESLDLAPADPARVPPRGLAWTGLILVLLLVGGYALWRSNWLASGSAPEIAMSTSTSTPAPEASEQPAAAPPPPVAAPAPATGPVALTATDIVWVRITDAAGKRLFEKEMQPGERYQLPDGAEAPVITTGRPNMLKVTLGDTEIPPLGEPEKRIKNVPLTAEALRARLAATAPGTPAGPTAPAASSPATGAPAAAPSPSPAGA
ncbi:DUF4115 domain-containing protein [Sphingomonas changnyeongensis]|uniref:DUF4115 domain-containing protein n=1 Tax=Sphingomonas changnyeongensis TaxID=2698679 RepID=A0A7Z2NXM8_9SPHN|nr:helix-turn-helix domain-containing protein [Sphingomonas changnyeongensis]QHL91685.1 DUF4115 domain-containing protein [Sphingomonas changnyeongensis]